MRLPAIYQFTIVLVLGAGKGEGGFWDAGVPVWWITRTPDAPIRERRIMMLRIASGVARPPALRKTGMPISGPKKRSGTQRGSRHVTG